MKAITFFRFISAVHPENPIHTLSFSIGLYLRKTSCNRVTFDLDVCDVDLDMQMSFLNAELFEGYDGCRKMRPWKINLSAPIL